MTSKTVKTFRTVFIGCNKSVRGELWINQWIILGLLYEWWRLVNMDDCVGSSWREIANSHGYINCVKWWDACDKDIFTCSKTYWSLSLKIDARFSFVSFVLFSRWMQYDGQEEWMLCTFDESYGRQCEEKGFFSTLACTVYLLFFCVANPGSWNF